MTAAALLESIFAPPPEASDVDLSDPRGQGIRVCDSEREGVLRLLMHSAPSATDEEEVEADGTRKALRCEALQHEWVVTCHRSGYDGDQGHLCHRLYFKDAANEVRLGTVLVSEL